MGKAWTPAEDDIIRAMWPTTYEALAAALPGRTAEAIRGRRKKLKITRWAWNAWQPHEDEIIQRCYKVLSHKEMAMLLPGRTEHAVTQRASHLGALRLSLKQLSPAKYTEFVNAEAARIGCKPASLLRGMRRHAVYARWEIWRRLHAEGYSQPSIARAASFRLCTVARAIRECRAT